MEYIIVLLLGVILGVGVVFLLRPQLFVRRSQDFSMLEAMYDQMVEDLEEREQRLYAQLEALDRHMQKQSTPGEEPSATEKRETVKHTAPKASPAEPQDGSIHGTKVEAVSELLDQGCEPLAIAKRLGIGRGEVDLIVELRKSREQDFRI